MKKAVLFGKELLIIALCGLIPVSLIAYPAEVSAAVTRSVGRCMNVIIPSLFAFMAVSGILISYKGCEKLMLPFYPLSRYVMRLPPKLFFVFLAGNIAGYPMGIKLLSQMLDKGEIDRKTAEDMSVFCYCGGPAFYTGMIGLTVFGSAGAGLLVFLSIVLSNLLVGTVICRIRRPVCISSSDSTKPFGTVMTDSINDAAVSLFRISAVIVFFSVMMSIPRAMGVTDWLARRIGMSGNNRVLISSLFELTSVTGLAGAPYKLLPAVAAICSFGGICIVFQLFSLKSSRLSLKKFLLTRPLCAALSALICRLLFPIFISGAEQAAAHERTLVNVYNFPASICLILMIFLLNLKKGLVFSE